MKIAVIDLGTNTFHLLIVEVLGNHFHEVLRDRRFIHLAEDGIETIGNAAYERGLAAMIDFGEHIRAQQVAHVAAKGTAALRSASNGMQFIEEVRQKAAIHIETISGNEEARLIYLGVREAVQMTEEPMLIVDVGGGSVELIVANQSELLWAESFPVGVAVLYKLFHKTEPMTSVSIAALQQFLAETLAPVLPILEKNNVNTLIGASGAFDVLENIMTVKHQTKYAADVDIHDFQPLFDRVTHANLEERVAMEDIPNSRSKLIVVTIILVDFIIKHFHIQNIKVSNFSMKEGMIRELISG